MRQTPITCILDQYICLKQKQDLKQSELVFKSSSCASTESCNQSLRLDKGAMGTSDGNQPNKISTPYLQIRKCTPFAFVAKKMTQ